MIAYDISNTSVIFVARNQPWSLAADHPHFNRIRDMLKSGCQDEDSLIRLVDVRVAVGEVTDGRVVLSEESLLVDGEEMPEAWRQQALTNPEATRVLIVKAGDKIRVQGDDDAPDGIYTVGDIDNTDVAKRVYVESDDDFFGFISNVSIQEILASH